MIPTRKVCKQRLKEKSRVKEKQKDYFTVKRTLSSKNKKFLSQQIRGRLQESTSTSTRNLLLRMRPLIKQWMNYFKNTDGLQSITWKEKRKIMAWIDRHVYSSCEPSYKLRGCKRGASRLQRTANVVVYKDKICLRYTDSVASKS